LTQNTATLAEPVSTIQFDSRSLVKNFPDFNEKISSIFFYGSTVPDLLYEVFRSHTDTPSAA